MQASRGSIQKLRRLPKHPQNDISIPQNLHNRRRALLNNIQGNRESSTFPNPKCIDLICNKRAIVTGCSDSRGMRQTFSCLSKFGGMTNLIRILFGHVK